VIRESGIIDYDLDHVAVQRIVAQKRVEARRKQNTLMAEVKNYSALLLYALDGDSLPTGAALRGEPGVSPDRKAQKQRAHYRLPSSAPEAAALVYAG